MRIAIVTGASSGIGKEIAIAIDKEYTFDEIWLIARREERLLELAKGFKNKARAVALDLLKKEDIEAYAKLLEAEKPQVGLLVNNAGCGVFGPFKDADLPALLNSAQLNAMALTAFCHITLPYMEKGDGIINIGSNSSWQPVPNQAVYSASKAYVLSFSRSIGRELKPQGIHVMCVCPGWIKTEFQEKAEHDRYIQYVDRWYEASEVAAQAMKDYKKKKKVSILGFPVRSQVRLVKFLPVDLVMAIWCKQQGIK